MDIHSVAGSREEIPSRWMLSAAVRRILIRGSWGTEKGCLETVGRAATRQGCDPTIEQGKDEVNHPGEMNACEFLDVVWAAGFQRGTRHAMKVEVAEKANHWQWSDAGMLA
jgi:hypothetical protein